MKMAASQTITKAVARSIDASTNQPVASVTTAATSHCGSDNAHAAKPLRKLIARDRDKDPDKARDGEQDRRAWQPGRRSRLCRGDRQEGDAPGAQRRHLPGVHGVAGDPGHRRPVAKHRAKIQQRARIAVSRMKRRSLGHHDPGERERDQRGDAAEQECGRCSESGPDQSGDGGGASACDTDAGRMHRHRARLRVAFERVGDRLQPRHVGAGPADPGHRAQDGRVQKPSATKPKPRCDIAVNAGPDSIDARVGTRSVSDTSTGTATT